MGIVITWTMLCVSPAQLSERSGKQTVVPSISVATQITDFEKSPQVDAGQRYLAASDSSLNRFQKHLLNGAVLLDHRLTPVLPNGERREERLWRTNFKYPLIREELWSHDHQGKKEVVRRVFSVADHVLIKFPEGITEAEIRGWVKQRGYYLRHSLKTTAVKIIAVPNADLEATDLLIQAFKRDFPEGTEHKIAVAERDYLVFPSVVPDDSGFGNLWGLNNTGQTGGVVDADIDAPEAWDITTGTREVLVGVIDTGVDRTHPDLAANMWKNPGEIAGNGVDDDGNGFVDDVFGWDFFSNDNDPMDEDHHGTHCAGTIGAVGNNLTGVSGVCWQVSLVGIRFLGPDGGTTSDAIESIYYASSLGVQLTSNSWGGGDDSVLMEEAIREAGRSEILFVAAAGNDGQDDDILPQYPASYALENIISVASSTASDTRSSFSNYGVQTVDLAAPGSSIYSTIPGPSYATLSGTSMATPHVAGALALAKGIAPLVSAAELKQKLLTSVDRLPEFMSTTVSGGRLNAAQLVESLAAPYPLLTVTEVTEMPGGNGDGILNPGESLRVAFTLKNRGTKSATNVVAELASEQVGGSHFQIVERTSQVGTLLPGESWLGGGQFVVRSMLDIPTPYTEEMQVTLRYGDPLEERVQPLNLYLYTSSVVSGQVRDKADNSPMVEATVLLQGASVQTVKTDEEGRYQATVTDGNVLVSARASGYLESAAVEVMTPPEVSGIDFYLERPQLRVEPAELSEVALRGDILERSLSMTNYGTAPLDWSLRARNISGLTKSYYLSGAAGVSAAVPDLTLASPAGKLNLPSRMLSLGDLSGITVGAVATSLDRSVLLNDLRDRGAVVITLTPPLTADSLEKVDAVILDDALVTLSVGDIDHLRAAVQAGMGLLCEADNLGSLPNGNLLLSGTGIKPAYDDFRDLTLTDIVPHPITMGVSLLRELAVGWTADLSGVAVPLVREPGGRVHAAVSQLGQGVVVFVGNEITNASNFSIGDGRLFANQIVEGLLNGPDWLKVTPASGSLAPGEQGALKVILDARTVSAGDSVAEILVSSNIPDEPALSVPIGLNVQEVPVLSVDDNAIDFGEVIERSVASRDLEITNTGTADLVLPTPLLTGAGADAFEVTPGGAVILAPGEKHVLNVSLAKTAELGNYEAVLILGSNDPRRSRVEISLTGKHVEAPKIIVTPKSTKLRLLQGQTVMRTYTVKNTGKGILRGRASVVLATTDPQDWVEVEGSDEFILEPGKKTKIILRFSTRAYVPGVYSGLLRVSSDDPDSPEIDCSLVMTSVAAPVPAYDILAFGKTYVGETQGQLMRLSNEGTVNLTLKVARGLSAAFRVGLKLPLTIKPGESALVPITFAPKSPGEIHSSLVFAANVPGVFFQVPISGLSVKPPTLKMTPASLTVSTAPGLALMRSIKLANVGEEALDWSLETEVGSEAWLQVSQAGGTLPPGAQDLIQLNFTTDQMEAGIYRSAITLHTNDPKRADVRVPIALKVTRQAVLRAAPSLVNLGQVWIDQPAEATFDLMNVGNLPLEIRQVSSSSANLIPVGLGKLVLQPGEPMVLTSSFESSRSQSFQGQLTVRSNSGVTRTINLEVLAEVVNPPTMKVLPGTVAETVLPSDQKEVELTVRNEGQAALEWHAELAGEIDSPDSAGTLEEVLERLNAKSSKLTRLIPNRYDFTDGALGYSIVNGGNQMYNTGNLLSTNLNGGQSIAYTDGNITVNQNLGPNSRYFTRKLPGMFVMAADLQDVSMFRILGNLGAGGEGGATGNILHRHGYVGFFKSVVGVHTPSVYHLILLPEDGHLMHRFPGDTRLDDHEVTGLPKNTRLYTLVFGTAAGGSVSDSRVEQIMDHFLLNIVHGLDASWLQLMTESGASAPGLDSTLVMNLDARGLSAGVYEGDVKVLGNAPETPAMNIPVTLTVPSAAVLTLDVESLDMEDTPVNGFHEQVVTLRNDGNAVLVVDSITTSDPVFQVDQETPFQVDVGMAQAVKVRFIPSEARAYEEMLSLVTNSAKGSLVNVPLTGLGIPAPKVRVSPESFSLTMRPGVAASQDIILENLGTATLAWSFPTLFATGTLSEIQGTLEVGETKVVTLRSSSTATTPPGETTELISLYTNDPVSPVIKISYTRIVLEEPQLLVTPSSLNFGTLNLPGDVQKQIVLKNVGNALLTVSGVSLPSSSLTLPGADFPVNLAVNETKALSVKFASPEPEVLSGSLLFATNRVVSPSVSIPVSGQSIIPPAIMISPGRLNASVEEGQSIETGLSLQNDGGAVLNWVANIQPSSAASWLKLSRYNGSVNPGETSELAVELSAEALSASEQSATITLSSNAVVNGIVDVPVVLVVTPGELSVSTESILTTTLQGSSLPSSLLTLQARAGESPAWSLTSNAAWILPSASSGNGSAEIAVNYESSLTEGTHTGSITISTANVTRVVQVTRVVLKAEFSQLLTDRQHNRILGLVRGIGGKSSVLVSIDPSSLVLQDVLSLPADITDMDLSTDERVLYAISYAGQSLSRVNLDDFTLVATKSIPTNSSFSAFYLVQAGREGTVYYVDGASSPAIHVYDFNSGADVSTFRLQGLQGIGAIKVSPDGKTLFARSQTGGGNSGAAILARVNCSNSTLAQTGASSAVLDQDSSKHPILLSSNLDEVMTQGRFFTTTNLEGGVQGQLTPNKIYNASAYLDVVVTDSQILNGNDGALVQNLPVTTTVTAFAPDQKSLIYHDPVSGVFGQVDTSYLPPISIRSEILEGMVKNVTFDTLAWSGDPSVASYDIYFGTDASAVANAEYGGLSNEFLVSTPATSYRLNANQLALGQTYYWRIDARAADDSVSKGGVMSFKMAQVGATPEQLSGSAMQGSAVIQELPLAILTKDASVPWTLRSDSSWVIPQSSAGTGPATVTISLNPANLMAGVTQAHLTLTSDMDEVDIPVDFEVLSTLNIVKMQADPVLPVVYALHREVGSPYSSWLLWVDAQTAQVTHGVKVGNAALDFTAHLTDDRIYVLVDDGRLVQIVERQGSKALQSSYTISPPQVAIHATSYTRCVTLSAANSLQLRLSGSGVALGSPAQLLGKNGLTTVSADGTSIYAAVTQSSSNVGLVRYAVTGAGVTFMTANYFSGSLQGALLLPTNGTKLIYGGNAYSTTTLNLIANLGQSLLAISPNAALGVTSSTIYSLGPPVVSVAPLPVSTTLMTFSADGAQLLIFSPQTGSFQSVISP